MRLFFGLHLPAETVRSLEALVDRLRPTARIHWCPPVEPAHHHQVRRRMARRAVGRNEGGRRGG